MANEVNVAKYTSAYSLRHTHFERRFCNLLPTPNLDLLSSRCKSGECLLPRLTLQLLDVE